MVEWYHWLNGYEFKQTLGDGRGKEASVLQSMGAEKTVWHDWAAEQQHQPKGAQVILVWDLFLKLIWSDVVSLMEKAMAPYSSTLAWKIPWTEEPGRLHSMGSLGVGHDWATSLSLFTFMLWRSKLQPTPVFLPGKIQGREGLVHCCLWGRTESDMTERLNWTE